MLLTSVILLWHKFIYEGIVMWINPRIVVLRAQGGVVPPLVQTRVSTEVTFWHSAEYGSDFRLNSGEIPRNSAEFRGISPEFSRNHFRSQKIPRNSVLAEFRGHPSSNLAGGEDQIHLIHLRVLLIILATLLLFLSMQIKLQLICSPPQPVSLQKTDSSMNNLCKAARQNACHSWQVRSYVERQWEDIFRLTMRNDYIQYIQPTIHWTLREKSIT